MPQGRTADYCAGSYAFTFASASRMNLCDDFFTATRFDLAKGAAEAPDKNTLPNGVTKTDFTRVRQLRGTYHDTDAMTLVHEWTHLNWIAATNSFQGGQQVPPETYEFGPCNTLATQRNPPQYHLNADSYAWYAEC